MVEQTNLLVKMDKVWCEPTDRGSILMAMTNSPFIGIEGFCAPILIGEQEFFAKFSFSGAISFEGESLSRGLYRATELNSARFPRPSKSEKTLSLSGPRFPKPLHAA